MGQIEGQLPASRYLFLLSSKSQYLFLRPLEKEVGNNRLVQKPVDIWARHYLVHFLVNPHALRLKVAPLVRPALENDALA